MREVVPQEAQPSEWKTGLIYWKKVTRLRHYSYPLCPTFAPGDVPPVKTREEHFRL